MLRVYCMAAVIWLVGAPALASAASCQDYCLKTRCAPGNVSYNQNICMTRCMQACNLKQKK